MPGSRSRGRRFRAAARRRCRARRGACAAPGSGIFTVSDRHQQHRAEQQRGNGGVAEHRQSAHRRQPGQRSPQHQQARCRQTHRRARPWRSRRRRLSEHGPEAGARRCARAATRRRSPPPCRLRKKRAWATVPRPAAISEAPTARSWPLPRSAVEEAQYDARRMPGRESRRATSRRRRARRLRR